MVPGSSWHPCQAYLPEALVWSYRFTLVAPYCLRMEASTTGVFVDARSLFASCREALEPPRWATPGSLGATQQLGPFAIELGPPGAEPALEVHCQPSSGTPISWQPGQQDPENLGGTLRTLDGVRGPVPLGEGLLSRSGWSVVDDSRGHLLEGDWVRARPAESGYDWYLFVFGLDYRQALRDLRAVAGGVPLPPRFAFGSWYSRYWPHTSAEYRQLVADYEAHGLPLDVMVLDMDWHREGWTGWSWNRELLPDAEALLAELGDAGLAVTLNLHPADGVGPHEDAYPSFMAALGRSATSAETVPFDAGDQAYMEALFDEVHGPLEEAGVDFFWLDWQQQPHTLSLPELSNLRWLNELYFRRTAGRSGRGMSFSRWGGWGDHRNPIHFSGDASTGWEMLAFQVPFTSLAGNVGCFFWSHDIGGHMGPRNEETMTRWVQFGALSASLRMHATRAAHLDPRPWVCEGPFAHAMRRAFQLRARLMPYIYTAAEQSCREMVPLLRPLYLDWPEQERAYHVPQQFLLGDDLLAVPIVRPGIGPELRAGQPAWFPPTPGGCWIPLEGGRPVPAGTEWILRAAIDEVPVFARAGAAVPLRPEAGARMTSPLGADAVLRCFPGADGQVASAWLYEDDGGSAGHEAGAVRTPFLARWSARGVDLEIGPAEGPGLEGAGDRSWRIELFGVHRPEQMALGGGEAVEPPWGTNAEGMWIQLPAAHPRGVVRLHVSWDTRSSVQAAPAALTEGDGGQQGPQTLEATGRLAVRREGRGLRVWASQPGVESLQLTLMARTGREEQARQRSHVLPAPGTSHLVALEEGPDGPPPFGLVSTLGGQVLARVGGAEVAWTVPIERRRRFAATWQLGPLLERPSGRSLDSFEPSGDWDVTPVQVDAAGWLDFKVCWRRRYMHAATARLVLRSPIQQEVELEVQSRGGICLWLDGTLLLAQAADEWDDPIETAARAVLQPGENVVEVICGRSHWGWGLRLAVDGVTPLEP